MYVKHAKLCRKSSSHFSNCQTVQAQSEMYIYMSCISETACFPANCVEHMHLDSLPVGKECINWSHEALDRFHLLNVANGWGEFMSLVAGIVSANQRLSCH